MTTFKRIQVVSYEVSDWERAKQFYADILGWPLVWGDDTIGWMQYGYRGQTQIAISRREGPPLAPAGGAIAGFIVDDARETLAELRARGIRCDDIIDIPGVVTYATFYDPEGNRLQFASGD